jgi:hypothetical protein
VRRRSRCRFDTTPPVWPDCQPLQAGDLRGLSVVNSPVIPWGITFSGGKMSIGAKSTHVASPAKAPEVAPPELAVYIAEFNAIWQELTVRIQIRERIGSTSLAIHGALLALAVGVPPFNGFAPVGFNPREVLLISPLSHYSSKGCFSDNGSGSG